MSTQKNKNCLKCLFLILFCSIAFFTPQSFASEHFFAGKWTEAKIIIVAKSPTIKNTERILSIATDSVTIKSHDGLHSKQITAYLNSTQKYPVLQLDNGNYAKLVSENVLLFFEGNNLSPALFVRDGMPLPLSNKAINGVWAYQSDTRGLITFHFNGSKLIIEYEKMPKEIRKSESSMHRSKETIEYYVLNAVFEATPLNEEYAILYVTYPPGITRDIIILEKKNNIKKSK